MAILRPDGVIQTEDGRQLYGDDSPNVQDVLDLVRSFSAPPGGFAGAGGGFGGGGGRGRGAQGPQGPGNGGGGGSQGAQGPQGDAGAAGSTGPQGPQGLAGTAGTAGAQGPQGPIGLVGAQGPQGPAGMTDFTFAFSGTLNTIQNVLIPPLSKATAVELYRFDVLLNEAPGGSDAIFTFFVEGLQVAQVTVLEGQTQGSFVPGSPIAVPAFDVVTAEITQVGSGVPGTTATMIARVQ